MISACVSVKLVAVADRLETILVQARKDRKRLDGAAMGAFSLTTLGIASVRSDSQPRG